jgi:hypothetical protein
MPPDETAAPPADPDPGDTHAAAHESARQLEDQVAGHGDAITELRDKVDDLEALVHGTVTMILEDDEEAGPEKTTVAPRQDPPAADKKDDATPPPADSTAKRHSGLFS